MLQEIWNKHKCTENHIPFRAYRVKSSNDFYGIQ